MRVLPIILSLLLTACNYGIYTRDGVTDGDTFYLAPNAMVDDDPAYQSWVTYSLIKSACQLQIGDDNPARANSFDCEYRSRQQLLNTWSEKIEEKPTVIDKYLDTLRRVSDAGFLAEYTAHYFADASWDVPQDLRHSEFQAWRRENLRRHRGKTRLTGSWNYRSQVEE